MWTYEKKRSVTVAPEIEGKAKKWKPYQQALLASQFTKDGLARYNEGTII